MNKLGLRFEIRLLCIPNSRTREPKGFETKERCSRTRRARRDFLRLSRHLHDPLLPKIVLAKEIDIISHSVILTLSAIPEEERGRASKV